MGRKEDRRGSSLTIDRVVFNKLTKEKPECPTGLSSGVGQA